jgi:hypothetical protein
VYEEEGGGNPLLEAGEADDVDVEGVGVELEDLRGGGTARGGDGIITLLRVVPVRSSFEERPREKRTWKRSVIYKLSVLRKWCTSERERSGLRRKERNVA